MTSRWVGLAVAGGLMAVAYAALLGLGMHRHGNPWAISLAATVITFAPPMAVAGASPRAHRWARMSWAMGGWAILLWLAIPVYFPGERNAAVASGLALLSGDEVARRLAEGLPGELSLARPEVPEAAIAVTPDLPPPVPLSDTEIALPYEGEGRRLAVPVVFEHGGKTAEVYMMLDTGATYTTLPSRLLDELGVPHGEGTPVIQLQTANGQRDAAVALIDRVWLGDLPIDGVSIATCDPCEGEDTVGLLGLNVAGGFNLNIDADRREVIFTRRDNYERHLDVKPHSDLDATFTRYPGGRVEVEVRFENQSARPVQEAVAAVACADERWRVTLHDIAPGSEAKVQRRLPAHEPCASYEISLESARW